MWEPAPSSPTNWNSMSCTTVPESPSSVRYSPKLAQTLKTLEEEALDLFEQKMETATISLAYASRERLRNYDNFKNRVIFLFV